MWFRKKPKEKKMKHGAIPYAFLVLGFFGATLTQEVMTIIHEWARSLDKTSFALYIVFVFIAWMAILITIMKFIEELYGE